MARKSRKQLLNSTGFARVQYDKKPWITGGYVRLSVEDIRKKESDSIGTQKLLITEYIEKSNDLTLYKIYEDINFSGTDFDRPAFQRLLEDAKRGAVNCIVVKDLSRFGRNYIEAGNFLERVFPFLGVRFISVNDNYDSLTADVLESGLIIPLLNLMNEVYARDISKKVQSQYEMKRKRGEFCGSFAPYGYSKQGKGLMVDEATAPIVKSIFSWVLEGLSDESIAKKLNEMSIKPPSRYRYEKGIVKADKFAKAEFWHKSAIKRITENYAYIGVLAQGRVKSAMLENSSCIKNIPKENWIITPDAHPSLIDTETFEKVQQIRSNRKIACKKMQLSQKPAGEENIIKV